MRNEIRKKNDRINGENGKKKSKRSAGYERADRQNKGSEKKWLTRDTIR